MRYTDLLCDFERSLQGKRELLPDIDDFLGPMSNKIVIMFVVAQEVVISPGFPAFDPPRTAICSYILYM
jgi:hypothetical protein